MDPYPETIAAAESAPAITGGEAARPAFDTVYEGHRTLLRRLAIRKFNVPPRDAEDLVQDVFATYLANASKVRDVRAYLIGAICNAARHYRRRDEASPFCATTLLPAASDEALAEDVLRSLTLATALEQLGPRCQETLKRYYLLGEKAVDIARSRSQSANYISRLLNYCRNRARELYEARR